MVKLQERSGNCFMSSPPECIKLKKWENPTLVYCEGLFGEIDGKVTNGLVRKSDKYKIIGVIDSTKAGMDAGKYLTGKPNGIPIYTDLDEALEKSSVKPEYFILGVAPAVAFLSKEQKELLEKAMKNHMSIINGFHEFLTNDTDFMEKARKYRVSVEDVRKPPEKKDLKLYTGKIRKVGCPILAVFGTDAALGKRTTTMELDEALKKKGLKTVFVSTGQTGLMQGAKYGISLDAVVEEYMTGEIEDAVVSAFENEKPDIILVEGQGSLSHPAYLSSCGIARGALPKAVILQHSPKRKYRVDFPLEFVPSLEKEMELVEVFSEAKIIALTLNHEKMAEEEVNQTVKKYEEKYGLPTCDVLIHGCDKLVESVLKFFPELKEKIGAEK